MTSNILVQGPVNEAGLRYIVRYIDRDYKRILWNTVCSCSGICVSGAAGVREGMRGVVCFESAFVTPQGVGFGAWGLGGYMLKIKFWRKSLTS